MGANLRTHNLIQPYHPQEAQHLNYVNQWYNAALLVVSKQLNTIVMNAELSISERETSRLRPWLTFFRRS